MQDLHSHRLTPELLQEILQLHEQIKRNTNGQPLEDSTELIRQQREERTRQLMGEEE